MDDPDSERIIPCPRCAEVETDGQPCSLCRQEDEAMQMATDASKRADAAKKLAAATHAKYPSIDGAKDLGTGMP